MPAKTILSPGQRAAIFDPPTDREAVERFYTLGPDDLVQVCRRRRGANRIGYAVQLCYLRHPGRALAPGEAPSATMLSLLCEQVGGDPAEFEHYAARGPTLRERRAEIEALLGLRAFERADLRAMLAVGIEVAASTDRGETIVAVMVERLRAARVVVPAASALERIALIARAQARRAAYAGLIRDCTDEQETRLEHLIDASEEGRTGLGWIRDWSEAPSATNLKALVERLERVRSLGIEPDRARRIHGARYAVIARVAGLVTAQHEQTVDPTQQVIGGVVVVETKAVEQRPLRYLPTHHAPKPPPPRSSESRRHHRRKRDFFNSLGRFRRAKRLAAFCPLPGVTIQVQFAPRL